MKTMLLAVVSSILFSGIALAADISGTWTGIMKTNEGGAFEVTLTAKASGNTFTGTFGQGSSDPRPIENGKIDGNQISFSLSFHNGDKSNSVDYTGTVEGKELKLVIHAKKPRELTLTKQ